MINKLRKNEKGLTLIEIMMAVFLFSVIVMAAGNVFQIVMKSQRNIISSQNLQENMLFATEAMSKEIRMARLDYEGVCGDLNHVYSTNVNKNELYFINQYGECVSYYLADDNGDGINQIMIQRVAGTEDERTYPRPARVTPDDINIEDFKVNITDDIENKQSMVTILMKMVTVGIDEMDERLQFTVSSRYYHAKGASTATADFCNDMDGDGYGSPTSAACLKPGLDCDDANANIYPGAKELCNGVDDDCDGAIDEGCPPAATSIAYKDSTHSAEDCVSAGGEVVSIEGDSNGTEVCKMSRSSCLSGWQPADNWTSTISMTCPESSLTCHPATCNCRTFSDSPTPCSTGSHVWGNVNQETCTYTSMEFTYNLFYEETIDVDTDYGDACSWVLPQLDGNLAHRFNLNVAQNEAEWTYFKEEGYLHTCSAQLIEVGCY